MKNLSFLFFVFFYTFGFSQNTSGIITYTLYYNFSEEKLNSNNIATGLYKKAVLNNGKKNYLLYFNEKYTEFNKDISISSEYDFSSHFNTKILYNKARKCFIYNKPKSIIFIKENYKISKCDSISWKIESESKLIDNKLCFKATCIDYTLFKGKAKNKFITAWFCPEIPLNIGPLCYNGLPGLIMELTINEETSYVLNKIEYIKDIEIKEIQGKEIDFESYEKLQDKHLQELLESVRKN